MKKNIYLFISILISPIFLIGQIEIEKKNSTEDVNNNYILIWINQNEEKTLIDTIWMFPGLGCVNYSHSVYNGKIYESFEIFGRKLNNLGNSYFIRIYDIENFSLRLIEEFNIDPKRYTKLLKKGMSIKFIDSGLCFSFEEGKIKEIIFSYQDLDTYILPKILKKISRF